MITATEFNEKIACNDLRGNYLYLTIVQASDITIDLSGYDVYFSKNFMNIRCEDDLVKITLNKDLVTKIILVNAEKSEIIDWV